MRIKHVFNSGNPWIAPNPRDAKIRSILGISPNVANLPPNIDLFESVVDKIAELENSIVAKQVKQVLRHLYLTVLQVNENNPIRFRVPPIKLIEHENQAVLLEWRLQHARVGFIMKPEPERSCYFMKATENIGSFVTSVRKIYKDLSISIANVVRFALMNC
jgi:hypothetical protein